MFHADIRPIGRIFNRCFSGRNYWSSSRGLCDRSINFVGLYETLWKGKARCWRWNSTLSTTRNGNAQRQVRNHRRPFRFTARFTPVNKFRVRFEVVYRNKLVSARVPIISLVLFVWFWFHGRNRSYLIMTSCSAFFESALANFVSDRPWRPWFQFCSFQKPQF